MPPLTAGQKLLIAGIAVHGALIAGLWIDLQPPLAVVNESPSLPRGLYFRDAGASPATGAVVAFAQPAVGRDYLAGLGMPPEVLLIKRVAAVEGEAVCTEGDTLRTPNRTVDVRTRDRSGRALPRWHGCRRLAPGEIVVLGDTPVSFDSRYFGPLRTEQLAGVYSEGIRW